MRRLLPVLGLSALLVACDAGPKATPAEPKAVAVGEPAAASAQAAPLRAEPVRTVAGKPIWTSNRRYSAEENARSHFERDGADFGADTVDAYVAKAHAFTTKPPKGTLKLERPNGDKLFYDPKANTFAVMARTGAPRTMFKPRDGRAYWERQVRIEAEKSARR